MLRTVLACALAAAFVQPATAEVIPSLHDALPQEYQSEGIKVAVFNDWAPDEFLDADGQLKGWSVDLAKAMEDRLGVPFTFEGTSFDAVIPGIMSKRFDAGLASFGTTPERLMTMDFVAQRKIGTAFAYPESSDLDIETPEQACGLTVAIQNGSWDMQLIEELNENQCEDNKINIQSHATQAQAELAVRSKRAQATVAGSLKLAHMAQQTGDLQVSDLVLAPVNSCIGVRKDDPLGQVLVDAIQSMIDDGTYQQIMADWGIADSGMLTEAALITEDNPDF
ncbi:transporter substrate-binding domain-containing protein [Paracoccus rhizosphaerae]|uniref:Transporter substrate-binding domain-containing protein n=1 Tax=Paracoccus rhizosphaerae TaxID=1133347 RepID=A0ABV6CIG8_9RHOB|nr:transporter substrate-binding domain-containing protein [Paracoccus rhizosphaerae]